MSEADLQKEVTEIFDGLTFPAAKIQIVVYADEHGASDDVMDRLRDLPVHNYNNLHEIVEALGLTEEQQEKEKHGSPHRHRA